MKLSIIIPYHNSLELTKKLLDILIPQLTNETELIIVDDDCNEYVLDKYVRDNIKVIHHKKNSGCAGIPRNTGLDNKTKGTKYVFIDSDDLVSNKYVETILNKIKTVDFDYCFFSWKFNGKKYDEVIIQDQPPSWNCCVWNCIYSNEDARFNDKKIGEDYDFNLIARKGKKENIEDILYFYNDNRKGSVTYEYIHNNS